MTPYCAPGGRQAATACTVIAAFCASVGTTPLRWIRSRIRPVTQAQVSAGRSPQFDLIVKGARTGVALATGAAARGRIRYAAATTARTTIANESLPIRTGA